MAVDMTEEEEEGTTKLMKMKMKRNEEINLKAPTTIVKVKGTIQMNGESLRKKE